MEELLIEKKEMLLAPSEVALNTTTLPNIPEKRYFTIGEASVLCAVKPHVLRYWEQEFPQINPSKRRGNRRYYRYQDIILIREIRHLLYEQGYTIAGAKAKVAGEGNALQTGINKDLKHLVREVRRELEEVLGLLR